MGVGTAWQSASPRAGWHCMWIAPWLRAWTGLIRTVWESPLMAWLWWEESLRVLRHLLRSVCKHTRMYVVPITYCVMRIMYPSSHQLLAHYTYTKYISKRSQSAFKPKVRFMEDEGLSVYRSYYTPSWTSAFILIQVSRRIGHSVADKRIEILHFLYATVCYKLPVQFLT